jgi:hydrogenase maturation factor HypF (carbamoyltransferase family)
VKREIIRLKGRVQGVGFRYQVLRIAQRFSVVGNVRNLRADRSLEIDVEGSAEEIERFIQAVLAEPPPSARIDTVTRASAEPRYPTSFDVLPTAD